jgi:hypothetical protein
MTVTMCCRVHYMDLQAYLAKVYRMQGYDILKATGATNGMFPEYLVTGRMPDARNIGQQVDNIRRGRRTRQLALILDVLCRDGFIPPGKYVIDTTLPPDPYLVYTKLIGEHQDPNHPECVEFREKQRSPDFKRRAKVLDKLTLEHREQLEEANERT